MKCADIVSLQWLGWEIPEVILGVMATSGEQTNQRSRACPARAEEEEEGMQVAPGRQIVGGGRSV